MKLYHRALFILVIGLGGLWGNLTAQEEAACPEIVTTAIAAVSQFCADTGRNTACYGNAALTAELRAGVDTTVFDTPGETITIADLRSLRLALLDETAGEWGIALLRIQANLPDTLPGENVTLLLFGDVAVTNTGVPVFTMTAERRTNLRAAPTTTGAVIRELAPATALTANGRTADSRWLYVSTTDGDAGWVFADTVTGEDDPASLTVADETSAATISPWRPLQAFTFRSGLGDSACSAAPESGLLIQSPQGIGRIDLLVNEVNIQFGSTVYLQAQPNAAMSLRVIEGAATVTAADQTTFVPAGSQTNVPLDANGVAAGAPAPAEPYDAAALAALPLALLKQEITVVEPLTPEAIAAATNTWLSSQTPIPGAWRRTIANPVYECPPGAPTDAAGGRLTQITHSFDTDLIPIGVSDDGLTAYYGQAAYTAAGAGVYTGSIRYGDSEYAVRLEVLSPESMRYTETYLGADCPGAMFVENLALVSPAGR